MSKASFCHITSKTRSHNGVYHVSLVHPPAIPLRLCTKTLVCWRVRFSSSVFNEIKTADRKNESAKSVLRHDRRWRTIGPHHDRGKRISVICICSFISHDNCRLCVCMWIISFSIINGIIRTYLS